MNVLLTTLNTKYIHKSLALRWLYVTRPSFVSCDVLEFTISEKIEKILNKIDLEKYDVIGISVYIWNNQETKTLIHKIKELKPEIRIILGGPDVTFENDDWFLEPIEAIVIGEGEKAFWEYLETGFSKSVKTRAKEEKELARVDITWLEQFENPYFLDFDLEDMSNRYLYLETSRGCPYGCKYCLSETDRQVRTFSEEYLNKVFNRLKDFHIYQIKFLDRTFNLEPKRALRILKELNSIQSVDSYQMELVAETLPEEILLFMENEMDKDRFRFEVGVQSFNEETLKACHRISNLSRLEEVITRLVSHQIVVHTDLIAGLPYENLESFEESFNHLYRLNSAEVQCGTLKLLKGTSLRKEANELNIVYDLKSPYEVQYTKWITKDDMRVIHMVAKGVEKCFNNGRLTYTLQEIFRESSLSPFQLFYKLGVMIDTLPRPYQLVEYFKEAYNVLRGIVSDKELEGLLNVDYYKNTFTKPKQLFEKENLSEVYDFIYQSKKFNNYQLEHYSVLTPIYYHKEKFAQLLIYHDRVMKAERYIIDVKNQKIEEWI